MLDSNEIVFGVKDHTEAVSFADLTGALADDPERRAVQIPDRVVEEAELPGPLPFARDHVLAVADQRVEGTLGETRRDAPARRAGCTSTIARSRRSRRRRASR